jgi:hypothetical protein
MGVAWPVWQRRLSYSSGEGGLESSECIVITLPDRLPSLRLVYIDRVSYF